MTEEVILLGCGDVGPIHEPMEHYSELVRDTLQSADIRFGQVERTYSERGELRPGSGGAHGRLPPRMVSVITDCGFNVASMAGNHAMDWGAEALLDTIELLRGNDIQTIGAGRTALFSRNWKPDPKAPPGPADSNSSTSEACSAPCQTQATAPGKRAHASLQSARSSLCIFPTARAPIIPLDRREPLAAPSIGARLRQSGS